MGERVIVAMDGSTNVSTAALLAVNAAGKGGDDAEAQSWKVLACRADQDGRGQARALLRHVDGMLIETGRQPADIGALLVGVGPGTFTGVRIAVATARGLALALGVPVLGLSTLSALAAQAEATGPLPGDAEPEVIVPVVDARRGQVFYGVYRRKPMPGGPVVARSEAFGVCDRDALLSTVAQGGAPTLVVGHSAVLQAAGHDSDGSWRRSPRPGVPAFLPLEVGAEHLLVGQSALVEPGDGIEGCRLAPWLMGVLSGSTSPWYSVQRSGDPGTPEAVKPIYVRSPDADIHITKMRDPWADAPAER